MFKRNQKHKKKGSLIIEQLLVFPIMIGLIWLIMQMIIFVYSNNQVNVAANETAHSLSQMLRGTDKKLNEIDSNNRIVIQDEALKKVLGTLEQNRFVMLAKDSSGSVDTTYLREEMGQVTGHIEYDAAVPGDEERVLLIIEDPALCDTTIKESGKKRVVCLYTEDGIDQSGTLKKNSQQVVVRIKAPFHLIGSIIPGVDDKISLYGNGLSTKEIPGRYQYY